MNRDLPLYNMIQAYRIRGYLDKTAFRQAFASLVAGSDVLRTVIREFEGFPTQSTVPEIDAALETVDLSSSPDPDSALDQWLADRSSRLLNPEQQLFDSALLQIGPDDWVWYLCQHHVISDGLSFSILFEQLAERYSLAGAEQLAQATPIPSFSDYVDFERNARNSSDASVVRAYWDEQRRKAPSLTELYGHPLRNDTPETRRFSFSLGKERSAHLRQIAASDPFASLSPDLSLHALWATLIATTLHRVTGNSFLCLGTPIQNRARAFRQTPGLFIEIGMLNLAFDAEDSFETLYSKVLGELFDTVRHCKPGSSSAEINRAYQVLLNFVTAKYRSFAGLPVETRWLHSGYGDGSHAIRLQVCDFDSSGDFELLIDLRKDLCSNSRDQWLTQHIETTIDAFLEDPARPIGSFSLLTAEQRQRLLIEFNDTADPALGTRSVLSRFRQVAQELPEAVAAIQGERRLSFAELDRISGRLAAHLHGRGISSGDRVALLLPRSIDAITAIWGALRAGAAFCPIDPDVPEARLRMLLSDLDPAAVLTSGRLHRNLDFFSTDRICFVDQLPAGEPGVGPTAPTEQPAPGDPAYLIFTSGSTGPPKAAMIPHGALANYVNWAAKEYLNDQALDFPLYSPLAFDLTLTSIFLPAVTGGSIVIYDNADRPGLEILNVFDDDRVDVVKLTPAHLDLMRRHGIRSRRIAKLILGGEDLTAELARTVNTAFPRQIDLYNEYGPTEATIGCMTHRFDPALDQGKSVPIGHPIANTRILLQDAYGQPVPPGVTGEMVIEGAGVATGYRNRPELTRERFIQLNDGTRRYRTGDVGRWDSSGRIEFLGRSDRQVKLRGMRVELGAVESALLEFPGIESARVEKYTPEPAAAVSIRHCIRCGLPSNYPNARIDTRGVCGDCRDYEALKSEVDRYFQAPEQLSRMLSDVRRDATEDPYDCIVLTSGGKDSTYMLYRLVREYRVRPLVFTLDNGYLSDAALDNVRSACSDLNVDLEIGSTPHMDAIFADSLRRHCNVCNGCFKTLYTLSMSLARRLCISTIVTGLSRGQLFETRLADTFHARMFDPDAIDELVMDARKVYHQIDDAVYELIETDLFEDDRIFDEIRFIDFYRYVDVGLDEVYRYLTEQTSWTRPPDTGRSTNCRINDAGIYVHTRIRGYHNYALPYSWDVRLGHKRRDAALHELQDEIDEPAVRRILRDIGFDEQALDAGQSAPRLVAYYVCHSEVDPRKLKEHLARHLPAYEIPAQYIPLAQFPLTPNGKVDPRALPDPNQAAGATRLDLSSPFIPPSTADELLLAEIWSQAIGLSEIGIDDDFFELGGDSVMSIQIAQESTIRGLRFTPRQLFQNSTIRSLIKFIGSSHQQIIAVTQEQRSLKDSPDSAVTQADRDSLLANLGQETFEQIEALYPLTPTQMGMLFHSQDDSSKHLYEGQLVSTLTGDLDMEDLKQAWHQVCLRHAVLRTGIHWLGLEAPLQSVYKNPDPAIDVLDWRHRTPEAQRKAFSQLIADTRAHSFNLSAGPLTRMLLVRTGDREASLIWKVHHIILDGWSSYPVLTEWLRIYQGLRTGTRTLLAPAIPFEQYVQWLHSRDQPLDAQFWRTALAGVIEGTALPLPHPEGIAPNRQTEFWHTLSERISQSLYQLARAHRVTLNAVIQAAWSILISRYTDSEDVTHGTTFSGRDADIPGAGEIVGILLNTLPIRLRPKADTKFVDWLAEVHQTLAQIGARQHDSLPAVMGSVQLQSDIPLFDTLVVLENYPQITPRRENIRLEELSFDTPSHYPLALLVYPERPIRLGFILDETRFQEHAIRRLAQHFINLLTAIADSPNWLIGDLPMLSPEERHQRLSAGELKSNAPEPPSVFMEILRTIQRCPDRIALASDNQQLTYSDLDKLSDAVAAFLISRGIGRGSLVAISADSNTRTIAAMLGSWKAGAGFMPCDPKAPPERLRLILQDSRAAIVLSTAKHSSYLEDPTIEVTDLETILVADGNRHDATPRSVPERSSPQASDTAYVIFTSGSTGRPKGVVIQHRNLDVSTQARLVYYAHAPDAFLLLPPLFFDSAMAGLFWTLACGGRLIMPDLSGLMAPSALTGLISAEEVTHLLTLPTVYESILEAADPGQLHSIKTAIVAGEQPNSSLPAMHYELCPHADLFNEYGPTEATIWSHVFRIPPDFEGYGIPIGFPLPHIRQHVLDSRKRPVPTGVPGELYLQGPTLTPGYVNDQELTERLFVQLPEDLGNIGAGKAYRTGDRVVLEENGSLRFLGRTDQQIKLRGHRVEIGEVESALLAAPEVVTAVVEPIEHPGRPGDHMLVAWYVARADADSASIRDGLARRLPAYMLPSQLIAMDAVPKLPNGKTDRNALISSVQLHETGTLPGLLPETESERQLVELWKDVLGATAIDLNDSFFELGGDSISALKLSARCHRLGLHLSPRDIMEGRTIRNILNRFGGQSAQNAEQQAPSTFELTGLDDEDLRALLDDLDH